MRECPEWFQAELERIGGVNPYGEPIFKLIWSTDARMVVGGRWQKDGFEGYREGRLVPGEPCWALMIWEPREVMGSPDRWEEDYRDPETGYLECGGYPKYGRYRLLQRFMHREILQQPMERHWMDRKGNPRTEVLQTLKLKTYRMEPCGLMLDIMLPMLMAWRKLSDAEKIAALRQREYERNEAILKKAKDLRHDCKINRGSRLVQKRAELIEAGMKKAMAMAAQYGLGMAIQ